MKTTESKGKWSDLFDQAIEAYLEDGLDPNALPGTLAVALGTCPAIESRRRAVAMLGEGLASTVQAYISGGVNTSPNGASQDGLTQWWVGAQLPSLEIGVYSVVQCSDGRRISVMQELPEAQERFLLSAPGARVLMNEAELDALLESLLAFFGLLRESREKAATAEVKGEA